MKRILLLVVVLIVYGSFYPWQFQPRDLPANPIWILLHSWPVVIDRFLGRDAVLNLALYVPFGVFCFLSMDERRSSVFRSIMTLLAAALLSASIEMAQLFAVSRQCSLLDVVCNSGGAAIGILLAATFPSVFSQVVTEAEVVGVFRLSGTVALLYLWAGSQLFPFFPVLSQSSLRLKLALFLSWGTWPVRDFFESLCGWLAISAILECKFGRQRAKRMLAIALLAIPLKPFIAQRTTTGSEIVGALLAIGAWVLSKRVSRPMLVTGVLASAALAFGGLVPFRFAAEPQPFTWVPFLPMLQSPWESSFLTLLQKSFLYGAIVWLINKNGRGWMLSSLWVAIALAIVEGIQIFLPGRTPEVTDPLLALVLGFSLMLLERHARRNQTSRVAEAVGL